MVETVLTPAHPDPLKPLLNKPFARTLHHPRTQRQAQCLVPGIVDVLAMPFQIGIHGAQGLAGGLRQPLDVQGVRQVCQDAVRHAVAQAVPSPGKPPAGLGGPPIQPGGRPLPQLVRRVVKVQNPCGIAGEHRPPKTYPTPRAPTPPDPPRRPPEAPSPRRPPPTPPRRARLI